MVHSILKFALLQYCSATTDAPGELSFCSMHNQSVSLASSTCNSLFSDSQAKCAWLYRFAQLSRANSSCALDSISHDAVAVWCCTQSLVPFVLQNWCFKIWQQENKKPHCNSCGIWSAAVSRWVIPSRVRCLDDIADLQHCHQQDAQTIHLLVTDTWNLSTIVLCFAF